MYLKTTMCKFPTYKAITHSTQVRDQTDTHTWHGFIVDVVLFVGVLIHVTGAILIREYFQFAEYEILQRHLYLVIVDSLKVVCIWSNTYHFFQL